MRGRLLGRYGQLSAHKIWLHATKRTEEDRWSEGEQEEDNERYDGRAPSIMAAAPAL